MSGRGLIIISSAKLALVIDYECMYRRIDSGGECTVNLISIRSGAVEKRGVNVCLY
jgi:hypothetical protein